MLLATSPSGRIGDEELDMSEDSFTSVPYRRSGSGKIASSFPGVGIYMAAKASETSQAMVPNTVEANKSVGVAGDVVSLCWMGFNPYVFPLFSLMPGGLILLLSLLILGLCISVLRYIVLIEY